MGSFYDLLEQRRMVRHYAGEPAPREALERIAATVRRAPSGGFSQGQRLLVVDDPELLARIVALDDEPPREGVEPWVETAPAQIFVMTREDDYHDRYQHFTFVAGVTLGYPLPDPGWSSKTSRATQRRRTLDEVVKWNRWSS